MNKALILLSGGQDSTTCLYWAKKKFDSIQAIGFNYGQRHVIELDFAKKICDKAKINHDKRVKDLTEKQVVAIRDVISKMELAIEGEHRSEVAMNIKRLRDIGSYKGVRHRRGLPVNGQRTKTNARTRKGRKKTVGMGKKALEKK